MGGTMTQFVLYNRQGMKLSQHPSLLGARTAAHRHVDNGDIIRWTKRRAAEFGYVNNGRIPRFIITEQK